MLIVSLMHIIFQEEKNLYKYSLVLDYNNGTAHIYRKWSKYLKKNYKINEFGLVS